MDAALKTDTFAADADRWLRDAQDALDALKALPDDAPFADVLAAYDEIGRGLGRAAHGAGLFFQVHPADAVREKAAEVEQAADRFATELSLDRAVYDRLAALDPDAAPDPAARRIVEHALRDFRRAGVDRDEPTRARVRALREELTRLGQDFSRNIAADVRSIRVPRERLEGLPDDWLAAHPPGDDGTVEVTTNPPDFLPFMKYCGDADLRHDLYVRYMRRGAPANLPVLDTILARRHELANLLGYPHWAAYVTEDKMIETDRAAADFIGRVAERAAERARRDVAELLEAARADDPSAERVRDCDRFFYAERVRSTRYAFDTREVRPYFAYERVKQGVFDTSARLYGLSFERADVETWHPDVEAWDLLEDGACVARLWLDMHPRDDKYKHAAMFDVVTGQLGRQLPEACLVCNFPKPSPSDPALLEPRDVKTFFHEFGHLLHHLLGGRQRWLSVSGIATEWDFVEVPSQLYEEWGRDADNLQRFARHHETDAPIPAELVERMRAADEFGKGLDARIQMFYASLSLELHRRDPAGLDTTAVVSELREALVPDFPYEDDTFFQASFGHLEGYSAIYYTYMWSLVLAKDLRGRFGDDLMDPQVAGDYRRCILEPGGSKDAADLVEDFLGRPFSFDAFEAWLAA